MKENLVYGFHAISKMQSNDAINIIRHEVINLTAYMYISTLFAL